MTVQEPLKVAREIALNPYDWVQDWKNQNRRKVVGTFGMYVPHELIHAAGIQPIILPVSDQPISSQVDTDMPSPPYCAFARGLLAHAIQGELNFLDGLAMHECCTTACALIELIPRRACQIGWFQPLWFPVPLHGGRTRQWLLNELEGFKHTLEQLSGEKITEARLRSSIGLYNYNRTLMNALYDLRRSRPGIISACEMHDVLLCGMVMPKEEHNLVLERLLGLLEKRASHSDRARLIISGSLCTQPWRSIMEVLDDSNIVVMDDDLYVGSRYYVTRVSETGDSLEALAESYQCMIAPCPTRWDPDNDWGDYVVRMTLSAGADALVSLIVRNCEPHEIAWPRIQQALAAAEVPQTSLQIEPQMPTAQARTILDALAERVCV